MPGGTGPRDAERSEALNRDAPEREPALELRLDRELLADLGLEAQLALVVPVLGAGGGERVERPALVVVDPVDGAPLRVLEGEHGAQNALAVAAPLERGSDRVDGDDQIVEVLVAH